MAKKTEQHQPEITIGLIGHVDHGKTTLLERLSGRWTDTHSEEVKRGITIRLGYANATIYKDPSKKELPYTTKAEKGFEPVRTISFVDAPGHESLMATMLSGAAIMDAALLLVSTTEDCPQPQTMEHLTALTMIGVKKLIILQNKIDLVSQERALEHYEQIKKFVKGTIAENAPIIPISAQHNINIDILINTIQESFPTPTRDQSKPPLMYVARSFDVNKPGTDIHSMNGGVLGGSLKQGMLKLNQEVEIRPGIKEEKEGKTTYKPLTTSIVGLHTGVDTLTEAHPGGSIAVLTTLDPSIVKSDSLIGNVIGIKESMPPVWEELLLKPNLLDRVVGSQKEAKVEPIKKGEMLMLNVNSAATVGVVVELRKNFIHVKLKRPVCASKEDRVTLSRLLENRFRLIGIGEIQ